MERPHASPPYAGVYVGSVILMGGRWLALYNLLVIVTTKSPNPHICVAGYAHICSVKMIVCVIMI